MSLRRLHRASIPPSVMSFVAHVSLKSSAIDARSVDGNRLRVRPLRARRVARERPQALHPATQGAVLPGGGRRA